jgi:RNA-directed DNA polymerase
VNIGAPWPSAREAWPRVLGIQTKLHRWAVDEGDRRFDDLFGLVTDPSFLVVAWERVRRNRGARTAGVDGQTARYITNVRGEEQFLADVRADLRAGRFVPLAVRERLIPKSGGGCAGSGSRPCATGWFRPPRRWVSWLHTVRVSIGSWR